MVYCIIAEFSVEQHGDEVYGGECHSEVFGGCHGYGGSLGACEVGGVPDGVGVVCGIDVDGS